MAVFALGAIASATASAEELPNFLPLGTGANPVTFTDSSGAGKLESVSKKVIECKKDKSLGAVNAPKLGTFDVLFEECKDAGSGAPCTSLDSTISGNILTSGTFHIRYELPIANKRPVIIFLINHVHSTCEIFGVKDLFLKLGCIAGKVSPTNTLTKVIEVLFKQTAGVNEIHEVDNEANTGMENCKLEIRLGTEAYEGVALEAHGESLGFKQGGVAVEALIMA
jgi:hypothetical protein